MQCTQLRLSRPGLEPYVQESKIVLHQTRPCAMLKGGYIESLSRPPRSQHAHDFTYITNPSPNPVSACASPSRAHLDLGPAVQNSLSFYTPLPTPTHTTPHNSLSTAQYTPLVKHNETYSSSVIRWHVFLVNTVSRFGLRCQERRLG